MYPRDFQAKLFGICLAISVGFVVVFAAIRGVIALMGLL